MAYVLPASYFIRGAHDFGAFQAIFARTDAGFAN